METSQIYSILYKVVKCNDAHLKSQHLSKAKMFASSRPGRATQGDLLNPTSPTYPPPKGMGVAQRTGTGSEQKRTGIL